jgi:DNA-binding MarR family transcriptional regulator
MEYQPLDVPDVPPAMMRRVGALLGLASQAAQEAGNNALAPLGLSVKDFAVLTFLGAERASPFSQQAIGERLRIDRTTMVAVIDDLEQAGLVRRERNADDRRAYVIKLTPKGARMQARAEKALDALMNDHYLAPLSEVERQTLAELLTRLVERSEQSR